MSPTSIHLNHENPFPFPSPNLVSSILKLPHIYNAPDAIPLLHGIERPVDAAQWLPVRDELVHLQLAGQVVVHQIGQLRAAFDAAERAAFPHTAGDQLERCMCES